MRQRNKHTPRCISASKHTGTCTAATAAAAVRDRALQSPSVLHCLGLTLQAVCMCTAPRRPRARRVQAVQLHDLHYYYYYRPCNYTGLYDFDAYPELAKFGLVDYDWSTASDHGRCCWHCSRQHAPPRLMMPAPGCIIIAPSIVPLLRTVAPLLPSRPLGITAVLFGTSEQCPRQHPPPRLTRAVPCPGPALLLQYPVLRRTMR